MGHSFSTCEDGGAGCSNCPRPPTAYVAAASCLSSSPSEPALPPTEEKHSPRQQSTASDMNPFADQAVDERARFGGHCGDCGERRSSEERIAEKRTEATVEKIVPTADDQCAMEPQITISHEISLTPSGICASTSAKADQIDEESDEVDSTREFRKALLASAVVAVALTAGIATSLSLASRRSVCSAEDFARTDLDICEPCSAGGYVLPLGGEVEQRMHWAFRGLVYFFSLGWMFTGVGLLCDSFMSAIEEITSQERLIHVDIKGQKRRFKVQIWNPTIANLSLMALGSSAPEILLNTIEVLGGRFFTGQLGPATIVGSAAFNLLVISAVCISAVPVEQVRRIHATDVFGVTAASSLLAYVWVLLVLCSITPNRVDVWEGVLTLLYFPLLLGVAYMADIGSWPFGGKLNPRRTEGACEKEESHEVRHSLTSASVTIQQWFSRAQKGSKTLEDIVDRLSKMSDRSDITGIVGTRISDAKYSHRKQVFGKLTRSSTREWSSRLGERRQSLNSLKTQSSVHSSPTDDTQAYVLNSEGTVSASIHSRSVGSSSTMGAIPTCNGEASASSASNRSALRKESNDKDSNFEKDSNLSFQLSVDNKNIEPWTEKWKDQFREAFYVAGSPGDQAAAGFWDWCCHCLSLCWKILAASVPPRTMFGGWCSFLGALVLVGMLTLVVGECASLLGCSVGIERETCAITLVALGTSLPDTFASRAAALHDSNADNSIGNITGSNSVNVFLGMGIPWTVASIYWAVKGANGATLEWLEHSFKGGRYKDVFHGTYPNGGFMVPAGTLGINVLIFSASALLCIASLVWRRRKYGGELGGPYNRAHSVCLILLWCAYIIASIIVARTA